MFPSRIFCIGRNYVDHVRELNNVLPEKPVIFMKPVTSLIRPGGAIRFPIHGMELHHEAEVVIQVGKEGRPKTRPEARSFVAGLALGLDLTLRDIQGYLKERGLPWETAKSFDDSAPLGEILPYDGALDLDDIEFTCLVNGTLRQRGNTGLMIFPVEVLLMEVGKIWRLKEGDLIYTGTPAGVGPLRAGDRVEVDSPQLPPCSWSIHEWHEDGKFTSAESGAPRNP